MSDESTEHTVSVADQMMNSLETIAPDSGTPSNVSDKPVDAKVDASTITREDEKPTETTESSAEESEAVESEQEAEAETEIPDEEDPEFKAAAEKHNLPTTLDDIPEEARPLVEKKLKDMQAGYTRAMQEAREYRKAEADFLAEQSYRTTAPDQWLADFIEQHPDVIEKVNAELEKRQDPTYAEAHTMKRDAERVKREAEVITAQQAEQRRAERVEHIESLVEASAKKNGIPSALVEDAIAAAIMAKPEDQRDITDSEIESIIAAKAKVYRAHVGAHKGAQTREYAKNKANDAKVATTPPRTVVTQEKPVAKKPASLEEAFNIALDNMGMAVTA